MIRFNTLFMLCLLFAACGKGKEYYQRVYFEFEMPFSISPSIDTIKVGDTLTIEAAFSDSLYDRKTRSRIYLPAFEFYNLFTCLELMSDTIALVKQPAGLHKFNAIPSTGAFVVTSNSFAHMMYDYSGGRYNSKFQLIAKAKGVFSIMLYPKNPNGLGLISLPQSLAPHSPGVKRFPVIQFNRYVFNEGHTHWPIFLQHCRDFIYPDSVSQKNATESIYTFVVK